MCNFKIKEKKKENWQNLKVEKSGTEHFLKVENLFCHNVKLGPFVFNFFFQ